MQVKFMFPAHGGAADRIKAAKNITLFLANDSQNRYLTMSTGERPEMVLLYGITRVPGCSVFILCSGFIDGFLYHSFPDYDFYNAYNNVELLIVCPSTDAGEDVFQHVLYRGIKFARKHRAMYDFDYWYPAVVDPDSAFREIENRVLKNHPAAEAAAAAALTCALSIHIPEDRNKPKPLSAAALENIRHAEKYGGPIDFTL